MMLKRCNYYLSLDVSAKNVESIQIVPCVICGQGQFTQEYYCILQTHWIAKHINSTFYREIKNISFFSSFQDTVFCNFLFSSIVSNSSSFSVLIPSSTLCKVYGSGNCQVLVWNRIRWKVFKGTTLGGIITFLIKCKGLAIKKFMPLVVIIGVHDILRNFWIL